MTGIIFLTNSDGDMLGEVEIGSDKVQWSYTGPDPDGEVEEYLKSVEDKNTYDWHEEVHDDMEVGQEAFDQMYLLEIYGTLDYLDYPPRVVGKNL
jgi:hypothetical protein